jgi:hypothetical protein
MIKNIVDNLKTYGSTIVKIEKKSRVYIMDSHMPLLSHLTMLSKLNPNLNLNLETKTLI